ncbi:DUF3073 domain-containing protein [Micromonospora sp. RTGN7]|uniref:DUF3073 domain-containing protein n=1 Tax=Micromonospora sp. RTGN7 TaxID=3016526 RepID=UPI0029FEECBD|nr:DUF3073 domain-containing protein [Micromonospora sp. RTGN7]
MGRGRAKAKQTKVARELKYHSPNTDLTALQRELAGAGKSEHDFVDDKEFADDDDEDHADEDPDPWVRPTR